MTTKQNDFNEEELMAEHAAEKARKEAAEKAEREANAALEHKIWLEKRKEERRAEAAKLLPYYTAIIAEVVKQGHKAERTDEDFTVDGVSVRWYIDFKEERTKIWSWGSTPNGKYRVTVGDYGNRKSFPQRKDGSFNYVDVAAILIGHAKQKLALKAAETQTSRNMKVAQKFAANHGLKVDGYSGLIVRPSTSDVEPIQLKFTLDKTVTVEKAAAIYAALKSVGLL